METDQQKIVRLEHELTQLRHRRKPVPWRAGFSIAFLVLGLLALIPAGMMLWLDRTVVRPESYIASMGPVIEQPAVQQAIQKSATDAIFSRVDVQQVVGQALPEQAQFLSGPISGQVKAYTGTTIGTIVASPKFATVWVSANQRAQAAFMNIAHNSSGNADVNLNELYGFISEQLKSTPLAALAGKPLPPSVGEINVITVPALERIPHFVAMLDAWRWGLIALVVALLALAVGISHKRRRAFVWTGMGVIGAAFLTLIIVRIARAYMIDPISDPVYRNAAVAVWQTVLNPFLVQTLVTVTLGVAIILTAWLLGPGRVAAKLRSQSQRQLAAGRSTLMPAAEQSWPVKSAARYHRPLQWCILGITILLLLLNTPLTVVATLWITCLGLVLLLILEFLAAPAPAAIAAAGGESASS